ncbi:MAG: hypothetical protein DRI57_23810 [Deltaproteobacteria bacterium]|nr:MAG: hypothetical protein DRI57_23810 [Deltaproteobacteria bacterium]
MRKTTRFYDPSSDEDGPVSGALCVIPLNFETAAGTNEAYYQQVHFPAGMGFRVTDVEVFCGTVTSDPSLTVGTAAAGAQIVAATNLATGANAPAIVSGVVAAGGLIDARITTDSTDEIALPISVNIAGFYTSPPTSRP